jgi:hypothetical protein
MSAASQCLTLQQTLTQNQNDFASKCPQSKETLVVTTRDKLSTQRDALKERFDAASTIAESYMSTLRTIKDARAPFDAYADDLSAQKKALEDENYELQQQIRAGRRRFLDDGPQEGVATILGFKTSDDKIMLGFWICYLFGISALVMMFIRPIATLTMRQKIAIFAGVLSASLAIAYGAITRLA